MLQYNTLLLSKNTLQPLQHPLPCLNPGPFPHAIAPSVNHAVRRANLALPRSIGLNTEKYVALEIHRSLLGISQKWPTHAVLPS